MNAQALKELLAFYDAAGVDTVLGDVPFDRFAAQEAARRASVKLEVSASAPTLPPQPSYGAQPAHDADNAYRHHGLAEAEALAAGAQSLNALRAALEGFDGCALKKSARSLVFADGNPQAKIMLIGEAPGRDEDAQGLPFVGRSGQLLDRMLAAIGLDRSTVYIGNVIYWRPPGNRTPTPEERALCEPFIRRQIALARPKVLMTLGGSALATLLHRQGIMKTRGQRLTYTHGDVSIPTVPTLHPAALLRNPVNKRLAWHDLLVLQSMIEEHDAL